MRITAQDGTTTNRTVQAVSTGECWIQLTDAEFEQKIEIIVVDAAGRRQVLIL